MIQNSNFKGRVALVHDFLVEYGGAERVLEALHEIWPQAPLYTALYDRSGPGMERFANWKIQTSWLQKLPFSRILLSPLRIFSLKMFEAFDFSDYDLVISSTAMYLAKGIITGAKTRHFSYIHTPPRFLYGYATSREWRKHWWVRLLGNLLNHRMRMLDFQASQRPDYLLTNSQFTADRIWKFYRRRAKIIYPPSPAFAPPLAGASAGKPVGGETNESYFLCVSRLTRAKRIDLAIQACNQLNLELRIVGSGREEQSLRSLAGKKTRFLGHLSDDQLAQAYSNCQALIFPAQDEDFGISPVEAMSFGKPVIALKSGGVLETIIEGKTGIFFNQPTVKSLIEALKRFNTADFNPADCLKQAQKFSKENFQTQIKKFVTDKIKQNPSL